jgi:hypothetical protein
MSEQSRGAGQPSWPLSPYQIQVSYGASGSASGQSSSSQSTSSSTGIARGTGADWFGPLNPLSPIAPPDVAGRRFDFPAGYNLITRPRGYEPIGFAELRGFADAYDVLRLVIETRKDQMERQRWRIRPRDPKFKRKNAAIDADVSGRIVEVERFLHKPDGVTRWKTWLRGLLEDMFVIDAATLYCQRTRSGQLCALQQLDGATIKRVIDDWGRTPQPYAGADGSTIFPPAFQQVLKGLPAVNYSARDIIYRPRNVRAHRVYGYSPVQQVLMTVNIALRRQLWQLDYFTEGSIPDALIGVPQGWAANLAQGDPWNAVSVHFPKRQGPFHSWEEAAINALERCAPYAAHWADWSIGGALTLLEEYNGLGYAQRGVPSPYVWAGTDQYKSGKYIADGHYDPHAVDHQFGCAALLARMAVADKSIKLGAVV